MRGNTCIRALSAWHSLNYYYIIKCTSSLKNMPIANRNRQQAYTARNPLTPRPSDHRHSASCQWSTPWRSCPPPLWRAPDTPGHQPPAGSPRSPGSPSGPPPPRQSTCPSSGRSRAPAHTHTQCSCAWRVGSCTRTAQTLCRGCSTLVGRDTRRAPILADSSRSQFGSRSSCWLLSGHRRPCLWRSDTWHNKNEKWLIMLLE